MFLVPRVWVPLNIICSNKCEMPVTPGCSFTEPTLAIHPAETFGEPLRCTSSSFIPLSSRTSWTGTFCAQRDREQIKKRVARYITCLGYMGKGDAVAFFP